MAQPSDDGDELGTVESDLGPFAIVPEWLIDHPDLSDRAVRLYAVLARVAGSRGSAWPGRKTLAARLRCSPSALDRALRELREAGAVTVTARTSATGRRTSNLYRLHLHPSPQVVRVIVTGDDDPLVTGDEVTTLTDSQEERQGVLRTPGGASPATSTDPPALVAAQFKDWWSTYPRKVGKRTAEAAWRRARKRAPVGVLLEGARRYRDDPNRRDAFTAHPTTWLNRDGWQDDPLPARQDGFTPDAWPGATAYDDPPRPL